MRPQDDGDNRVQRDALLELQNIAHVIELSPLSADTTEELLLSHLRDFGVDVVHPSVVRAVQIQSGAPLGSAASKRPLHCYDDSGKACASVSALLIFFLMTG